MTDDPQSAPPPRPAFETNAGRGAMAESRGGSAFST